MADIKNSSGYVVNQWSPGAVNDITKAPKITDPDEEIASDVGLLRGILAASTGASTGAESSYDSYRSTVYEKSAVIKAAPGLIFAIDGEMKPGAASARYWILLRDGATVRWSISVNHVSGTPTKFSYAAFGERIGLFCTTSITLFLSTDPLVPTAPVGADDAAIIMSLYK